MTVRDLMRAMKVPAIIMALFLTSSAPVSSLAPIDSILHPGFPASGRAPQVSPLIVAITSDRGGIAGAALIPSPDDRGN